MSNRTRRNVPGATNLVDSGWTSHSRPFEQETHAREVGARTSRFREQSFTCWTRSFGEMQGRRAVPLVVQTKLHLGSADDTYEREADSIAAQVVDRLWREDSRFQRPASDIRRRPPVAETSEVAPEIATTIEDLQKGGEPLARRISRPMEQTFGADFGKVRVHDDAQSDQLNHSLRSKAFTTGQHIFFRRGSFDPGARMGQELLAHELTHVVQQSEMRPTKSIDRLYEPRGHGSVSRLVQRMNVDSEDENNGWETVGNSTKTLEELGYTFTASDDNFASNHLAETLAEASAASENRLESDREVGMNTVLRENEETVKRLVHAVQFGQIKTIKQKLKEVPITCRYRLYGYRTERGRKVAELQRSGSADTRTGKVWVKVRFLNGKALSLRGIHRVG
jgi:hypothetical protein